MLLALFQARVVGAEAAALASPEEASAHIVAVPLPLNVCRTVQAAESE